MEFGLLKLKTSNVYAQRFVAHSKEMNDLRRHPSIATTYCLVYRIGDLVPNLEFSIPLPLCSLYPHSSTWCSLLIATLPAPSISHQQASSAPILHMPRTFRISPQPLTLANQLGTPSPHIQFLVGSQWLGADFHSCPRPHLVVLLSAFSGVSSPPPMTPGLPRSP